MANTIAILRVPIRVDGLYVGPGTYESGLPRVPDAPGTAAFINGVDTLNPAACDDPSLQTRSNSPWHPIILEWGVSVQPVSAGRQANPAINNTLDYASTFVTGSFQLQDNAPDVSPPKALPVGDRDTNLRTFLTKATLDDCRDRTANSEEGYFDRLITWYRTKHSVIPPMKDADKVPWAKHQKPFADAVGDVRPVADLLAGMPISPSQGPRTWSATAGTPRCRLSWTCTPWPSLGRWISSRPLRSVHKEG